jgi:L-seryl-tRNA(Ser) seleniumtransferase
VRNATGVILHTNLGRAPLPEVPVQSWYFNLEYDLSTGKRGQRDSHTSELMGKLLGVPTALVNNGAAAVYLALHELAAGGEVIVSRGELIEIGDGFRIPEIMARSGATLVEVGTTNKTRIDDYRHAVTERTRLLMRVHPSNFRMEGFTGRPSLEELTALGRETGVPVYEDLGSGCLLDLSDYGVKEPTIGQSLQAGVDLVSFSGDKLLGGPQAGILAGRKDLVQRVRRNPMFRALRLDKLVIAAMETTLRQLVLRDYDQIPVLRMVRMSLDELKARAETIASHFEGAEVVPGQSLLGGGSTPEQVLPSWLVSLSPEWDARFRMENPPLIGRIENGRLLLDPRTLSGSDPLLVGAL